MTVYDIAAKLPPIDVLRDRCKALAVLERIVGDSEPRYSYTRAWGEAEAALMNNGSGDEWAVVFTADGAFIRAFDHESAMTPYRNPDHELWPGLLDGIPTVFESQIEEPAFGDEEGQFVATAVLWRLWDDERWHAGQDIAFPPPRDRMTPPQTALACLRSCSTTSSTGTSLRRGLLRNQGEPNGGRARRHTTPAY